ncbi:hypothetical protein D1007_18404 [Hordeum vulgare]|nr:hypothetical protein D1007_18404 [Hordeum vulgare]
MDGEGFEVWGSQLSASGPATHAGLDLNYQASALKGFSGLGLYGAFLQSDDELLPGRGRSSRIPPYRPPRAGAGDGRANPSPPLARQLNFGRSSSAELVAEEETLACSLVGRRRGQAVAFGSTPTRWPWHMPAVTSLPAMAASAYRLRGHRGVPSVGKHPVSALPSTMMMKNWRTISKSYQASEVPR